jgi:hypothetical protein
MSLGTKLTGYLLLGVLVVMGLELYLSIKRIQTDLLHDVRREVAAMSRTLHIALTLIDRTETPKQAFTSFVASLSAFEDMLDVVFYDREAQIVARSTTLQEHQLPAVNIQQVMTTRTPAEGLFRAGRVQRYYRVEPVATRAARRPRQYCRCRRPTQHCPAPPDPHPAGRGDWTGTFHATASYHPP